MKINQAFVTALRANGTIAGLTSNRIYPIVAPPNATFPFVVYQMISNPPTHASVADADIHHPRYQFACFSDSYTEAHSVADAVEGVLRDFTGTLGGTSGVPVQRIFFDSEMEFATQDVETKETTHGVYSDYIIWHTTA